MYKVGAEDEGTRVICNYMEKVKKVEVLDLLNNDITPLGKKNNTNQKFKYKGCEFLGKVLHPAAEVPLIKLKLDHNRFGTPGLAKLAEGLAQNNSLESLSLCYCDIDENGFKYIQQILAFIDTKLIKLKLQGNLLRNKGVFQIFRALETNDTLEKINLADNQFGETEDIALIDKICEVIVNNKSLGSYDLGFNGLYEDCIKNFNIFF